MDLITKRKPEPELSKTPKCIGRLYPIVVVGMARSGQSSGEVDFSIYSEFADKLKSQGRGHEIIQALEALVKNFSD